MNQHVPPPNKTIMSISETGEIRPLRFDPAGCPIGQEVPEGLLSRWKDMLANCGAAQGQMHKSYERFFKEREACIRVLRDLLGDASGMADDLRDLANLFDMALNSDKVDGRLSEALRLVLGSMLSIADRLSALEERADATCERYHL